ncbi:phosphatidylinositol-specific phospholipase C/glycerophosphodiester phosphodiesterase family protein [Streptomyces sp. URMC 123]|uniref:phosphatidylinositol-specific phospholipase C/glycerophosphodiester phosphodiesterase family protein n=1 Tax=Streptomyces sp. URMC 123 TaxID=3423403 RepID=UPI003F1BEA31
MPRPSRRTVVTALGTAIAGGLAAAAPTSAWATAPAPAARGAATPRAAAAGAGTRTAATAAGTRAAVTGTEAPLRRAHAHNDYEHPRPLADALAHHFTSVEADIWLVGGRLLVGHDPWDLRPERTLEALYLDPLLARVRRGGGWVHPGHRVPVQLLIDIKNRGEATYRELDRCLRRYREMLSVATSGAAHLGAVTAVVSGDRAARAPMEAQRTRHAFYDGRLEDLGGAAPASFCPLISADWTKTFSWQGAGPMPAAERARLRAIVGEAHAHRRRVRFWATPDTPGPARDALWRELVAADVDHINTDDLPGLEAFLRAHDGERR